MTGPRRRYLDAAVAQRTAYFIEAAVRLIEPRPRNREEGHGSSTRSSASRVNCNGDLGDIAASLDTYRAALAAAPGRNQAYAGSQLGLAEGLRVNEGLAEALVLLEAAQKVAERETWCLKLARLPPPALETSSSPSARSRNCRAEHEQGLFVCAAPGPSRSGGRALGGPCRRGLRARTNAAAFRTLQSLRYVESRTPVSPHRGRESSDAGFSADVPQRAQHSA